MPDATDTPSGTKEQKAGNPSPRAPSRSKALTGLDTEVTKTNSENKLRTGSTHSEETHEVAKKPATHTFKNTSDKNGARTSASTSTVGSTHK